MLPQVEYVSDQGAQPPTPTRTNLSDADHPGVELKANIKSISHRCHQFEVALVWELTKETIHLPLGCLQGGEEKHSLARAGGTRATVRVDSRNSRLISLSLSVSPCLSLSLSVSLCLSLSHSFVCCFLSVSILLSLAYMVASTPSGQCWERITIPGIQFHIANTI